MTDPWVYTGDECDNIMTDIRTTPEEVIKYHCTKFEIYSTLHRP